MEEEPSLRRRTKFRNYPETLALCVIQANVSVAPLGKSWTDLELCPGPDVFAFSHIHTHTLGMDEAYATDLFIPLHSQTTLKLMSLVTLFNSPFYSEGTRLCSSVQNHF